MMENLYSCYELIICNKDRKIEIPNFNRLEAQINSLQDSAEISYT